MAAPSKKAFGVGLNGAYIIPLTTAGYPAATATTVYEGLVVGGPASLEVTTPDPAQIVHIGNNQVLQRDQLPSTDTSSAVLTVSRQDLDTLAAITAVKVQTVGDLNMLPMMSSQQGLEPTVGFYAYQQLKDESGNRRWNTWIFPKVTISPKPGSLSREARTLAYNITPNTTKKTIAGTLLSVADNGCVSAEYMIYESNYRLGVVAWLGDNSETDFAFPTARQAAAASNDAIRVYVNGTLTTTGITLGTDDLNFAVAPAAGAVIVAIYDMADASVDVA
jgi:hypothetical protein